MPETRLVAGVHALARIGTELGILHVHDLDAVVIAVDAAQVAELLIDANWFGLVQWVLEHK